MGTFGAFDNETIHRLSSYRLCGKALDDRCGIGGCPRCPEPQKFDIDLVMVSTVQEELSLYGAKALPLDLDAAIVIDVDFAGDTPSAFAENTPPPSAKALACACRPTPRPCSSPWRAAPQRKRAYACRRSLPGAICQEAPMPQLSASNAPCNPQHQHPTAQHAHGQRDCATSRDLDAAAKPRTPPRSCQAAVGSAALPTSCHK